MSLQAQPMGHSNPTTMVSGALQPGANYGPSTGGHAPPNFLSSFMSALSIAANALGGVSRSVAVTPISSIIDLTSSESQDWRVKINANWSLFPGNQLFSMLQLTGGLVWPLLPAVHFSYEANYEEIQPDHTNYAYQAYKSSQIREIRIDGNFFVETTYDANYWIAATTFLKTATKMFYGTSTPQGHPPIICNLSGYGPGIFPNVPVIIKSFEIDLPNDVDYKKTGSNNNVTWVPIYSKLSVGVVPVYNRMRMREFNLQDYASGNMISSDGVGWL